MEQELSISKARDTLSDLVEQVQYQGSTYIISRHGKPAAAVVPIEIYENWKRQRRAFFDAIRSIQSANAGADPEEAMEAVIQAQQTFRSSD
jgi:prevent-host-death family protein